MIEGKRVTVVLPAYNAAETLERTVQELPRSIVDRVLLTDDGSSDDTVAIARRLGLDILQHSANRGYGANQKTSYEAALASDADLVIMIHPDYQYSPRLVPALASMLACGHYDFVLGSRILGGRARKDGMPLYKYVANRFLTAFENVMTGAKLSEYHTGMRGYTRELLEAIQFTENSDDFVFDNQLILQALALDYRFGEISCPTRYMPEASSIGLRRSTTYGLGCVYWSVVYRLHRWSLIRHPIFGDGGA